MIDNHNLFVSLSAAEASYVSPGTGQITNYFSQLPQIITNLTPANVISNQAKLISEEFSNTTGIFALCVGTQRDSILNVIINGGASDQTPGLNSIQAKTGLTSSAPLIHSLYSIITGDPNGDN
jgi:hypothetical protein